MLKLFSIKFLITVVGIQYYWQSITYDLTNDVF